MANKFIINTRNGEITEVHTLNPQHYDPQRRLINEAADMSDPIDPREFMQVIPSSNESAVNFRANRWGMTPQSRYNAFRAGTNLAMRNVRKPVVVAPRQERSSFSERREVRYSFHGKMRDTGKVIDGHIEAPNSTIAIDRLADQGIIGVYSVRPDPLPIANELMLNGATPALPALPVPATTSSMGNPVGEVAITLLVEKLSSLVGQVEKILSRPIQTVTISGGGGGTARGNAPKKKMLGDDQNSVLKDILQSNITLRKSLEKLSSPAPVTSMAKPSEPRLVPAA